MFFVLQILAMGTSVRHDLADWLIDCGIGPHHLLVTSREEVATSLLKQFLVYRYSHPSLRTHCTLLIVLIMRFSLCCLMSAF